MNPVLAELAKKGELKREPTSPDEIKSFLDHAAQALSDAGVSGLSASGRFEFAYTAAHALAFAALRAHEVRPGAGRGHRAIVFFTLTQTVGVPDTFGSSLNRYHTKRNRSEYGQWVEVTEAEAKDLFELATTLQGRVLHWLEIHRPKLTSAK